jgi:hypothetical protein
MTEIITQVEVLEALYFSQIHTEMSQGAVLSIKKMELIVKLKHCEIKFIAIRIFQRIVSTHSFNE